MADSIRSVSPAEIRPNPENPRLIFRESELLELESSIADQGILVPLTVYDSSAGGLVILDGERRWRCARRLGLNRVPVIVQPEPTKLQNIMMMFAIHNARKEWDPLPTAFKLQQLEDMYTAVEGLPPNEAQLAQLASMSRGEVRRLKNLLRLPQHYLETLMEEAEKPRSQQTVTVDHVLEATRGAQALRKRGVLDDAGEENLRSAIVEKFRTGVVKNTVDPRRLSRIARAVEREEITVTAASRVAERLVTDARYSIDDAFRDSVERIDYEHGLEQQATRLREKLAHDLQGSAEIGPSLRDALAELADAIRSILHDGRQ